MFSFVFFILFFASTAVLTAVVVEDPQDPCSDLEFNCGDGACVSLNSYCDGKYDCDDGSDETGCYLGASSDLMSRVKRQARGRCSKVQWQCRDGSCIHFDAKCDGIVNCRDGSDETHPLCRKNQCQSNWFRCTYGACVDGAAPCNGVQDCADNSDELLPRCRREVQEVRGQFKCLSGEFISATLHCDGVRDCADGSDETVRACAGKTCPEYLFQCAYGACVDSGSDCNGIKECADGSDESDELCNRTTTIVTESPIKPTTTSVPVLGGKCVLPPYPKHGRYVVSGSPKAKPGQAFDVVALNITCSAGYDVIGKKDRICYNGYWSANMSDCVRFCRLNKDPSVLYKCLLEGDAEGYRECNPYEPVGTIVKPECNSPNYYSSGILNYMHCIDGSWDRIPHCLPGLTKNGTNVTILIKEDDYEIHVGTFQYAIQPDTSSYAPPNNQNTPSYTPPNSNQNIPSYTPPNSNQNIPSYTPPNYNQNIPSYTPPNSNQNTPSYTPPNYNQNIPSYTPPNSDQNIPSYTPPNYNQNIPSYTPPNSNQNIPSHTPPNCNQNIPSYTPPNYNQNIPNSNQNTPSYNTSPNSDSSTINFEQATPVTPEAPDYGIDENDWRFLDDSSVKQPQSNSLDTNSRIKQHSNSRKDLNVNVRVNNMGVHAQRGKVEVYNRDRIVFRD